MADGDRSPVFYSGMPPRDARTRTRSETMSSRRRPAPRKRLILTGVATLAVLAIAGSGVAVLIGSQEPARPAMAQPMSAAELERAEAAIAAGGGAAPGHIVSAELCAAVDAFVAAGDAAADAGDAAADAAVVAAIEQLAAVESPNRQTYRSYLDMTRDAASVPNIADAQRIASDFANAVQVDVSVCA